MSAPDFRQVAAQLRMPDGEDGIKTARYMGVNNQNMIRRTIEQLEMQIDETILEIGYGGGQHLSDLLSKVSGICYRGIDISLTMQQMAVEHNKEVGGNYAFLQADPLDGLLSLPFADNTFDKIFTVNTIYFWDNALAQAKEIFRVLKPGGLFIATFGSRDFMEGLPFTQYGFELYDAAKAIGLLQVAGFNVKDPIAETELVPGMEGEGIQRDFILLPAGK